MKTSDFLYLIDSTVARMYDFVYRSELSEFERHQIEQVRENILVKRRNLGAKLVALPHLEWSPLRDFLSPTQEKQLLEIKWIVSAGIESIQGAELISMATTFDTVIDSCLSTIQQLEASGLPGEPTTPAPEPEEEPEDKS